MIKNIILDLGGVVIGIDYSLTSKAFKRIGAENFDEIYSQRAQIDLFDSYETGKITSEVFRRELKKILAIEEVSDEDFDNAWNAMILDLPKETLDFIRELRSRYRVFLFSNTNGIHLSKVFDITERDLGISSFEGYFEAEYYSHTFGYRKPHRESFEILLHKHDLVPEETLFADDSLQHIVGAAEAGIQTIHVVAGKTIFDLPSFIIEIEDDTVSIEKHDRHDAKKQN